LLWVLIAGAYRGISSDLGPINDTWNKCLATCTMQHCLNKVDIIVRLISRGIIGQKLNGHDNLLHWLTTISTHDD